MSLPIGDPRGSPCPHDDGYEGQHVLAVVRVYGGEHIALPQHGLYVVLRRMFWNDKQKNRTIFNFLKFNVFWILMREWIHS